MPDLIVSFHGMALIGHGSRGEAWLIDTDRIRVGHKHTHKLILGTDTSVDLRGGKLVTFEDQGRRLDGALTLGGEAGEMVDLDAVLSGPRLRPEFLEKNPQPGGPWTDLLAAWIRLPGGVVDARAEEFEVWTFPKGGKRKLTEQFTITVKNVTAPSVTVAAADGAMHRIEIPAEQGVFRVHVAVGFNGEPSRFPTIGKPITLDEVLLLYACVTDGVATEAASLAFDMSNSLPTRIFTAEDDRRLRRRRSLTEDLTVCPPGCIAMAD